MASEFTVVPAKGSRIDSEQAEKDKRSRIDSEQPEKEQEMAKKERLFKYRLFHTPDLVLDMILKDVISIFCCKNE